MNNTKHLEISSFPFSIEVHPGWASIESSVDFHRKKHKFTQFYENCRRQN